MDLAPIVLFVYNRPDHTIRTLEALSVSDLADQSTLYIYSDGPKVDSSNNVFNKIKKVREVIRQKKWCKEVYIIESTYNKGLATSIENGITEIVNSHGQVIVLEDDIVVSKGFLKYCNKALELYAEDEEVMHIAASSYDIKSKPKQNTYFLKALQCHGWATWKRAWDCYNNDAIDHLSYFQPNSERARQFDIDDSAYFLEQLIKNVDGSLKSWAVKWYASWLRAGGIALFPSSSLVRNIGFDGTGENIGNTANYLSDPIDSLNISRIEIIEERHIRRSLSEFWRLYLQKLNIKNKKTSPRRLSSTLFNNARPLLGRVVKRLLASLIPELRPLLVSSHKTSTAFMVSSFKNSFIHPNAIIYNPSHVMYSRVGAYTYITLNAFVSYTEIGNFCSIGPNFICGWGIHPIYGISTSPSFYSKNPANKAKFGLDSSFQERRKITIGNDVFIGSNVTVLDGVTIGDGAVVGAGCVVSKNVPPYAIVAGNPMKILKYRFPDDVIDNIKTIRWWDWEGEELKMVSRYFNDPTKFISLSNDIITDKE